MKAVLAAVAASVAALAAAAALIATLVAVCCFGIDSDGNLESWGSRGTLGLACALRVRVGPTGLRFALL